MRPAGLASGSGHDRRGATSRALSKSAMPGGTCHHTTLITRTDHRNNSRVSKRERDADGRLP
eukprot:4790075-Heterocapsa_arctica.AAC.1